MHSVSLQFSHLNYTKSKITHSSKNSSQQSPNTQHTSVCTAAPTSFPSTNSWLHIFDSWTACYLGLSTYSKYTVYLNSLISVCLVYLLLRMMYFCSVWIQTPRTHGDIMEHPSWGNKRKCCGCVCVGEDDQTAQSEKENSWLTPYSWSMSSGLSRKSGYPVITIMCFSWEKHSRKKLKYTRGSSQGQTNNEEANIHPVEHLWSHLLHVYS